MSVVCVRGLALCSVVGVGVTVPYRPLMQLRGETAILDPAWAAFGAVIKERDEGAAERGPQRPCVSPAHDAA